MPALLRLFTILLAACAGFAGASHASDCAFTPAPATRLQSMTAVSDYKAVLKACVAADGRKAVAIREMTVQSQKVDLLVDPEALTTRLERAACWTCREESESELGETRMGRAIREFGSSAQASSIAAFSRMRGSLTAGTKAISSPATSAQARSRSIADFSCASSSAGPARSSGALDFRPLAYSSL